VLHLELKGVGVVIQNNAAIDFCALGPTARASGLKIDVVRANIQTAYDLVNVNDYCSR
jgi:Ni,Fe-hydrogenase III large subunit